MKSTYKSAAGTFSQFFIDLVNETQDELGEATDEAVEKAMKSRKFVKDVKNLVVDYANGAKKFALKHLKLITDGIAVATEPFQKNSFWKKGGPVELYFWNNFTSWVLNAIPETIQAFTGKLRKVQLTKSMYDSAILAELGNPVPFTIDEIGAILPAMLLKQANGESGELEANGHANIFYVQLKGGRVIAVLVYWFADDRDWNCDACDLDGDWWLVGRCVFSRS